MARRKKQVPEYGTIVLRGIEYYRTRVEDADGKRVALYARTPEELFDKVQTAKKTIEEAEFRRTTPTVRDYCEKWLQMKASQIRFTTMNDYRSKVKNYIIDPLGDMYLSDVTTDDIKLALCLPAEKSNSVYRGVQMLLKNIFESAVDAGLIQSSPCERISAKGGRPMEEREPLTDEQIQQLLIAIDGLPPYVFVMIGLYAGLRREEILALQWDCVHLDEEVPYLSVRRAWHLEHNRPVITRELKTKAARRDIPIPDQLVDCLREAKKNSKSKFVIANSEGKALSGTQFKRVWAYIVTRSTRRESITDMSMASKRNIR